MVQATVENSANVGSVTRMLKPLWSGISIATGVAYLWVSHQAFVIHGVWQLSLVFAVLALLAFSIPFGDRTDTPTGD